MWNYKIYMILTNTNTYYIVTTNINEVPVLYVYN